MFFYSPNFLVFFVLMLIPFFLFRKQRLYIIAAANVLFYGMAQIAGANGLAWLLCTAPDDKVRDGKRALAGAKKACELTDHKNGGYLDTLAAAHAEVGEFDKAVEWQAKALKMGDIPIKDMDSAKKRLELFKGKKPYRGD